MPGVSRRNPSDVFVKIRFHSEKNFFGRRAQRIVGLLAQQCRPILLTGVTIAMWIPKSALRATGLLTSLLLPLLFTDAAYTEEGPPSACDDAGLESGAVGLCNAYCDAMDCTNASDTACEAVKSEYLAMTGNSSLPCEEPKTCKCLDPTILLDRISKISEPEYVCYADTDYTPYSYVEYIVESGGVPQIGMGMEDQFDESWYCYYFEYQPGSEGELPEFFRYDLTAEDVDACRDALEPPFVCPAP